MINHAKIGLTYELEFIKSNNSHRCYSNPFWNFITSSLNLDIPLDTLYLVKTSHAYSHLHDCSINSKSDTYIAEGSIPSEILENLDFIVTEDILSDYGLKPIFLSGISIKKPDSKNYQILKISPTPFHNLFKNYDLNPAALGAGASVYCKKESEISKNFPLILGWGSNSDEFKSYFSNIASINLIDSPTITDEKKIKIFKDIKNFSTYRIKEIILKNSYLLDAIFSGKNIFDEPYVAHYIFENNTLKVNTPSDFKITTGSGRSKGVYQLEFKP